MYPPIKRLRTDENQDETTTGVAGGGASAAAPSMMDDFEMTDDELLFSATQVEQHDYQLYLAINDIDHTKTKAMSTQTNGICERFHKTILDIVTQNR